jgi:hypothetical protein
MIIKQLDIEGVSILEAENDPPIGANSDGPESPAIALQLMEAIAGKVKRLWRFRGVESRENILDPVKDLGCDLAAVATLEKPFKAQDHSGKSVQ